MEERKSETIHVCCAIPYRRATTVIEFCLVRSPDDRTWEFPKVTVKPDDCGWQLVADQARVQAGVEGTIDHHRPIGEFSSSRGNQSKSVTAFLLEVTNELPDADNRWCLCEEAKLRIRRKPMRRLVDEAQRMLDGRADGSPPSSREQRKDASQF